MIGAVSDEQDGQVQILMHGSQHWQARRTRQPQPGLFPGRSQLAQQLLILRKGADFIEDYLHVL